MNYTVFDVETANYQRNSICAIGFVSYYQDVKVREYYTLINPNTYFSSRCVEVHGILPDMVVGAPTFTEFWRDFSNYFTDTVLVAHNAAFDLGCLAASLSENLLPVPPISYICTCILARKHGYKPCNLDALCRHFNLSLQHHHNAMCDTYACADLLHTLCNVHNLEKEDLVKEYTPSFLN